MCVKHKAKAALIEAIVIKNSKNMDLVVSKPI